MRYKPFNFEDTPIFFPHVSKTLESEDYGIVLKVFRASRFVHIGSLYRRSSSLSSSNRAMPPRPCLKSKAKPDHRTY